jgi:hypothetical protein
MPTATQLLRPEETWRSNSAQSASLIDTTKRDLTECSVGCSSLTEGAPSYKRDRVRGNPNATKRTSGAHQDESRINTLWVSPTGTIESPHLERYWYPI